MAMNPGFCKECRFEDQLCPRRRRVYKKTCVRRVVSERIEALGLQDLAPLLFPEKAEER